MLGRREREGLLSCLGFGRLGRLGSLRTSLRCVTSLVVRVYVVEGDRRYIRGLWEEMSDISGYL